MQQILYKRYTFFLISVHVPNLTIFDNVFSGHEPCHADQSGSDNWPAENVQK